MSNYFYRTFECVIRKEEKDYFYILQRIFFFTDIYLLIYFSSENETIV